MGKKNIAGLDQQKKKEKKDKMNKGNINEM